METYKLQLKLLSDATFGRGDGVAGLVDTEVEHDSQGLPYLRGRTLKGLLAEECANILFALAQSGTKLEAWEQAAQFLFGRPGSIADDGAGLHIGDATLPTDLCAAIAAELESQKPAYTAYEILDALTAIRRQTAMDVTGRPVDRSLRAMRVILRETVFEAEIIFTDPPTPEALALLAACASALRRVGTGRNRGRGRVTIALCDAQGQDVTAVHFERFEQEVNAC